MPKHSFKDFVDLCVRREKKTWRAISKTVNVDILTVHEWAVDDSVPHEAFEKIQKTMKAEATR